MSDGLRAHYLVGWLDYKHMTERDDYNWFDAWVDKVSDVETAGSKCVVFKFPAAQESEIIGAVEQFLQRMYGIPKKPNS